MQHNFNEKKTEYSNKQGKELPVWQSPKYLDSKKKAIELIESEEYKNIIVDGDFWILMNETKSGKFVYTGLIISHNACLKINDVLPEEKKFHQKYCSEPKTITWDGNTVYYIEYRDDKGMLEYGEISMANCKNGYPLAMLNKRLFDRVVLKKSGIAQWGIYSDSEAEEFKEKIEPEETKEKPEETISTTDFSLLKTMFTQDEIKAMLDELGIAKASQMPKSYFESKVKGEGVKIF